MKLLLGVVLLAACSKVPGERLLSSDDCDLVRKACAQSVALHDGRISEDLRDLCLRLLVGCTRASERERT